MSQVPPYVVFDIETDGYFGPIDRIGVGLPQATYTLPWDARVRERCATLLSRPNVLKVAHNIQFDAPKLRDQGAVVAPPWWDTMLSAQLIEPDMPKALRSAVPLFLDARPWKHLSASEPARYNAADVSYTRALFLAHHAILEDEGMLRYFQDILMPGVPVLIGQSELGLTVDLDERERLTQYLAEYQLDAIRTWEGMTSTYHASNKDVMALLYNQMGLKVQKNKDTGQPSVDVEAIESLRARYPQHAPLLEALLEIRRCEKLANTYLDMTGAARGMVHARFLPGAKDDEAEASGKGAASTGRLGSSPNLMNVPGEWKHRGRRLEGRAEAEEIRAQGGKVLPPIRSMFVPRRRGDVFLANDYGQLELRIIAALSGDKAMQAALDGPLGIHETTRRSIEAVTGEPCSKVLAKNYSFLTWYGGGAPGLVSFFRGKGIHISLSQAEAGQRGVALAYPTGWAWRNEMGRRCVVDGWLREPFGRKRHFYGGKRDVSEAMDFKPQATGASMLWSQLPGQWALAQRLGGHFPLTVHDDYLHEVPLEGVAEYRAAVKELLEVEYPQVAPGFRVPTEAKVGKNWGQMEELRD